MIEKEWTYEIEWIEKDRKGFGEFSISAGKKVLAALKNTCGAYSYRTMPASGGSVIRDVTGFVMKPTNGGIVTEVRL